MMTIVIIIWQVMMLMMTGHFSPKLVSQILRAVVQQKPEHGGHHQLEGVAQGGQHGLAAQRVDEEAACEARHHGRDPAGQRMQLAGSLEAIAEVGTVCLKFNRSRPILEPSPCSVSKDPLSRPLVMIFECFQQGKGPSRGLH